MSIFLDHDDFKKSRRALVVTCFVVIGLHYVQLNSDEMSLLSLKIQVDKEKIIFGGKCLIIYLTAMFLAHWIAHHSRNFSENFKEVKKSLADNLEKARGLVRSRLEAPAYSEALKGVEFVPDEQVEEIEKMLERTSASIKRLEWQLRLTDLLVDFLIPLTLSALALSNLHFYVAQFARKFLS